MLKAKVQTKIKSFIKDIETLNSLPAPKHKNFVLAEYPFDAQLLNLSPLYLKSRKLYADLGGDFTPKLCSMMRSLSTEDLFKNDISYTPSLSELLWFKDYYKVLADPEAEIDALMRFNEIALFHEQNHRIIWKLLPPAPTEQADLRRYLNFAESLVVTLDLAMGDEIGKKLSPVFERMNVIYRPGGEGVKFKGNKKEYRQYLLALVCATYYALEFVDNRDIDKAVNYVLPGQKKINSAAVGRGLELNVFFSEVTNPQWQALYWKDSAAKLKNLHKESKEEALHLPEDPLEIEAELFYARRIFDVFNL